jgi:hypothetical protein
VKKSTRLDKAEHFCSQTVYYTFTVSKISATVDNSLPLSHSLTLTARTRLASTLKRDAEAAINQLTAMLYTAELENQHLKRDIQKWATLAQDFRASTANSRQIVNEASLVLEKLKSSLPSIRT